MLLNIKKAGFLIVLIILIGPYKLLSLYFIFPILFSLSLILCDLSTLLQLS